MGDTIWWWNVSLRPKPLKSLPSRLQEERIITHHRQSRKYDRYTNASCSLRRLRMNCFMDLNAKNLNYDLKQSNLHTPLLYSWIHLKDWCMKNCCWKLLVSLCGAKRKKPTRDITECVLHGAGHCCHGDSVTHGSLIWIYRGALFCVCDLCMYVHKHVHKCT